MREWLIEHGSSAAIGFSGAGILLGLFIVIVWAIGRRRDAKLKELQDGRPRCKHGRDKFRGPKCEQCYKEAEEFFAKSEKPTWSAESDQPGDLRASVPWPKRPDKIEVLFNVEKELKFDVVAQDVHERYNDIIPHPGRLSSDVLKNVSHSSGRHVQSLEISAKYDSAFALEEDFDSFCKLCCEAENPESTWLRRSREVKFHENTAVAIYDRVVYEFLKFQDSEPPPVAPSFRVNQWVRHKRGALGRIVNADDPNYPRVEWPINGKAEVMPTAKVNLFPAVPNRGEVWHWMHSSCDKCASSYIRHRSPESFKVVNSWEGSALNAAGCVEPVNFGKGE